MSSTYWQGKTLGKYNLIRLLGRGGMGEVWLADDTKLRRQVAIKLLPPVLMTDQQYLQDFAYEARAAAALEHPHILPVHDFGEQQVDDGEIVTYLIMPYMGGGTLRDQMRTFGGMLPITESIRYLQQAAEAIDYAHSRRVLHRDIKPGNMLLQQEWLFLADFGLAKLLTSGTQRSKTHAGAGTPEYMAPEQVQGHAEPASDRYSLAMIAYQLFTGLLPFRGETPYDTLIKQLQEPPPPPSRFNPRIPSIVEEALLRGLAKRPEARPASCADFVQALEKGWQVGAQTQADPDATLLAPWNKRYGRQSSTSPMIGSQENGAHVGQKEAASLTEVASIPTAPWPAVTIPQTEGTPVHTGFSQTAPYPQTLPESMTTPSLGPEQRNSKMGRRTVLIGAVSAAALVVAGGVAANTVLHNFHTQKPLAAKSLLGPRKFMPGVPLLSLTGHSDTVWNALWDSTGHYLATSSKDTRVMLWNVGSLLTKRQSIAQTIAQPQAKWKFTQAISIDGICWMGNRFIAVAPGEVYKFYTIDTQAKATDYQLYLDSKNIGNLGTRYSYNYVSWSVAKSILAVTGLPEPIVVDVELWSTKNTQQPLQTLSDSASPLSIAVSKTRWSPDGLYLIGVLENLTLVVWDIKTGAVKYTLTLPERTKHAVYTLRTMVLWSQTNPYQIITSNIDVVTLWDIRQKTPLLSLGTDDPNTLKASPSKLGIPFMQNVIGLAWSPNGRYVAASYGRSSKVYVWDLQDKAPRKTKDGVHLPSHVFGDPGGHSNTIVDVQWSPDGRYLATASFDKTVIVWNVDAG